MPSFRSRVRYPCCDKAFGRDEHPASSGIFCGQGRTAYSSLGNRRRLRMSKFILHAPGRYGAQQSQRFGYSQVMEIDGRVELSGQGGWHPETLDYPAGVSIETEVARAFDNVTFMLGSIGLNWSHVAHVNSYH